MPRRKFILLTFALLLVFTMLAGQIIGVAYADSDKQGKKDTHEWKKDASLEKYLKPLLNVKVKNGEVTFTNGLVNKGWKNKASLTGLSYTIKVYPHNQKDFVWSSTKQVSKNSKGIIDLKPGRSKEFDDYFDISKSTWNLRTGRNQSLVKPGKYKAVVEWRAWMDRKEYSASVSKTFMIHEKDLKGSKPTPSPSPSQTPQDKPDIYVDLNTVKQDGKLNVDIALLNKSKDQVTLNFSSLKQYDIIISGGGGIVYDTRGSFSGQALSFVNVNAGETYNFSRVVWDYTDLNGNKVPTGKYTVQVVMNPTNKEALRKKYNLVLEDSEAVAVADDDIRYDIDALLRTEFVGRQLMLDFEIRNRTAGDITVQFRSAQRFKVLLFNKNGAKVYEYPSDSMSAQYLAEDVIRRNSSQQYGPVFVNLTDLGLTPDEYTAKVEFNVFGIFDRSGKEIGGSLYSMTASKTLNLTELDLNKYAAVSAEKSHF